ncbi:hypothetical protein F511_14792 [Dorcoceras hygrometricum]|uniref:Uncharacterized protein n=1 Tax=Dorcoceras hygrometricum TaxID=472368 RepID=A0A2Z7BQF7_9LAMI|nr:hypothetical protein F511_14792 [Dorcoceras hygrometricum]
MQLVPIKRLGPGKFYLSHKGDHAFIKWNPSSHKGWMSRLFYVRWVGKKRNSWRCDMTWKDNMYTLTPSTPERSPNLATFLADMREMHFNAPEMIKEDLLCFFGFSRKGVELVGDLDERMGKAAMLKAMEEAEAATSGASAARQRRQSRRSPPLPWRRRPDDRRRRRRPPPRRHGPSPLPRRSGHRRSRSRRSRSVPPRCLSSPFLRPLPRSWGRRRKRALAWGGEVIKRLTQAQREGGDLRWSFDDTAEHCTELETRLAEVEDARAEEARAAEMHRATLETRGLRLEAERAALVFEKRALAAEKKAIEAEKVAMRAELDDTKARAEEDGGRLRSEAIHAWDLGKEEFLKSSEFDTLCAKKAVAYIRALMEMPDDEELEEEDEEEEEEETASGEELREEVAVRNWALSAELVELMFLRRRATRESASVELGFNDQVESPPEAFDSKDHELRK